MISVKSFRLSVRDDGHVGGTLDLLVIVLVVVPLLVVLAVVTAPLWM